MHPLSQKINLKQKDYFISNDEYELINSFSFDIFKQDIPKEAIVKMRSDIYYSMYRIDVNDSTFIIKLSPHEDIFRFDKKISNFFKETKKANILVNFLKSEKLSDNLEATLSICPKITVAENLLKSDLIIYEEILIAVLKHGSENLKEIDLKLDNQLHFIDNFFDLINFINFFKEEQKNSIEKNNNLDLKLIDDFSNIAKDYFIKNIFSKLKSRKEFCFGILSPNDFGILNKSNLPLILNVREAHIGNRFIDYLFFSSVNNIKLVNSKEMICEDYGLSNAQFNNIQDNSWIIKFVYAFFSELMHIVFIDSAPTKRMNNYSVYLENSIRLKTNQEFEQFYDFFRHFFVDKYK